jgi:PAS domain-containing protein
MQDVLEFFANLDLSEIRLIRFMESRLGCGLMQRRAGAEDMSWSRGMFTLLDLDPQTDQPSFSLLQSMIHPEDRRTIVEANANIEAAKPISRTYRIIRRDGTMRVLLQHLEFLVDSAGKPDRSIGVLCDVTDNEALRDQVDSLQKRVAALANFSDLILNIVRPDGFVTGILGNSAEKETALNERYGFLWREIIHPDDRAETIAYIEKAIAGRSGGTREHRIRQRDGAYRWRRTSWVPIFDRREQLQEFVSISLDIEKEKTLATSKETNRPITGAQVRAGRALARWSVQDLSDAACVSPSVVRRIEEYDGLTEGASAPLEAVRFALENAGIEFIFPATGKPGVRPA